MRRQLSETEVQVRCGLGVKGRLYEVAPEQKLITTEAIGSGPKQSIRVVYGAVASGKELHDAVRSRMDAQSGSRFLRAEGRLATKQEHGWVEDSKPGPRRGDRAEICKLGPPFSAIWPNFSGPARKALRHKNFWFTLLQIR